MFDHHYRVETEWTGAGERGTVDYRSYGRDLLLRAAGKPEIAGSADAPFRGDRERWNPEELLLGALSQCHLLSYLHVCAAAGVVVLGYRDEARGTLQQTRSGGGHFSSVTLRPVVTVAESGMVDRALALHGEAAEKCFIASSVNFEVRHEPSIHVAAAPSNPPRG